MPSPVTTPRPAAHPPTTAELLQRFLQAYWLRPENALWMTLRSGALQSASWAAPSLDLCCGDGVFTFLHHGGTFDPDFDVFTTVAHLERIRDQHADMFDCCDDRYAPILEQPAAATVDVGLDAKPALLQRAAHLKLYGRLVEHDANQPMPLADESFALVYCNAVYWMERVDNLLGEIARVLQPGGRAVLQVKLSSLREYTFERHETTLGRAWLDLIGRGRLASWPSLTDRATWERRFARAGLQIVAVTPFITRTHAHLWDVGLRPLAPLLVRMANGLTPASRSAVKREWVELCAQLLMPLCDPAADLFDPPAEPGELQYVLTRA